MKTGTLLKKFRYFREISVEEFHIETGFSKSYISAIENNKKEPSMRVLKKYAEYCGVNPSIILEIQEKSEEWTEEEVRAAVVRALYPSD